MARTTGRPEQDKDVPRQERWRQMGSPLNAPSSAVIVANERVTRARQSSARLTLLENAALLVDGGGVSDRLRSRV